VEGYDGIELGGGGGGGKVRKGGKGGGGRRERMYGEGGVEEKEGRVRGWRGAEGGWCGGGVGGGGVGEFAGAWALKVMSPRTGDVCSTKKSFSPEAMEHLRFSGLTHVGNEELRRWGGLSAHYFKTL